MDRALDPELLRRGRRRRIGLGVAAFVGVVALFVLLPGFLRPSLRKASLRTARVERGAVEAVLQASGNAVPALERALSAPVDARVERIFRRAGEAVRSGDEIVALDTAAARLDLGRLEDRVAQMASEERQARLALEAELANLASRAESQRLEASVAGIRALRERGIPILGYTWFPLFTMIDWKYRFGRGPVEEYRLDLGLYTLRNGAAPGRWAATPLVEQFRSYVSDPESAIGNIGVPAA